jgi:hypothetical protein
MTATTFLTTEPRRLLHALARQHPCIIAAYVIDLQTISESCHSPTGLRANIINKPSIHVAIPYD